MPVTTGKFWPTANEVKSSWRDVIGAGEPDTSREEVPLAGWGRLLEALVTTLGLFDTTGGLGMVDIPSQFYHFSRAPKRFVTEGPSLIKAFTHEPYKPISSYFGSKMEAIPSQVLGKYLDRGSAGKAFGVTWDDLIKREGMFPIPDRPGVVSGVLNTKANVLPMEDAAFREYYQKWYDSLSKIDKLSLEFGRSPGIDPSSLFTRDLLDKGYDAAYLTNVDMISHGAPKGLDELLLLNPDAMSLSYETLSRNPEFNREVARKQILERILKETERK